MKWNKVYTRKANEEEKEYYGVEYIWEGTLPELDEEILVSLGENSETFLDIWIEYNNFLGLENTDVDEFYWMSLPQFKKDEI